MSIWVQYKCKGGETLDSLLKSFKLKDNRVLLKYKGNQKIAKRLAAGDALNRGDTVWYPNNKQKIYWIKGPKGDSLVTEKEYRDWLNRKNREIDQAYRRILVTYTSAFERHKAQDEINDDQYIVAAMVGLFAPDPPVGQRRKATAAFKKFEGAVKSRNYKGIQKTIQPAAKSVQVYSRAVSNWVEGIIGSAEGYVDGLEFTRDVGMMCGTIAAVTITAPASIPAAMLVGAAANAGVGAAYDGAEIGGQSIAGVKTTSMSELQARALKRAASGAASGLLAGVIGKVAMPALSRAMMSRNILSRQASRIASTQFANRAWVRFLSGPSRKVLEREVANLGGTISDKVFEEVALRAISKQFIRLGVGGMMKALLKTDSAKKLDKELLNFVKGGEKNLRGKNEEEIGQRAANEMMKSSVIEDVFDSIFRDNEQAIVQEMAKGLQSRAKKG